MEIEDAYRAPLAQIHDDGYGFIARGAAKLLIAGLAQQGFTRGTVVELACGGGISSQMIAAAGYGVVGFDSSEAMLAVARERLPQARFEQRSLYDAEFPAGCVAVTAVGEAFNYRFDPRAGLEAMREVLTRAHAALKPGGLLIFDVAQRGAGLPRLEHTLREGPGWSVTSEVVEDRASGTLERRITSRSGPGLSNVDVELHRLVLYDHEEVFALLVELGFDPASLASYADDLWFSAGHGGFYAVRL